MPTRIEPRRFLATIVVTSIILIMTSCVQVDVIDRDGTQADESSSQRSGQHNLIAAGIVFEPRLDEVGRSVLRQGVNLLVKVENSGRYVERDVLVTVTLETDDQTAPLVEQQTVIAEIPVDETKNAHFRLRELVDLESHYVLTVAVAPCAGETFLDDNQRIFDLFVTSVP